MLKIKKQQAQYFFLTFIFTLFLANHFKNDMIYGRVVGVSDGDNITDLVSSKKHYKVRLSSIDTP
jgi:endonuclease YncB( thermonuclease family)